MDFPNILELFFDGKIDAQGAFTYQLKEPCSCVDIVISDGGSCWDVIAYNRFFYDDREEDFCKEDELLIR
jgi:hypothetical protein